MARPQTAEDGPSPMKRLEMMQRLGLISAGPGIGQELDGLGIQDTGQEPASASAGERAAAVINKGATTAVNLRRKLAKLKAEGRQDEALRQVYVDLRGTLFNTFRSLHETNPNVDRSAIRIPVELEPPAGWATWATFVDPKDLQIGKTPLGIFGADDLIALGIVLAVSALVARSLNVDKAVLAWTDRLDLQTKIGQDMLSADPAVRERAIDANKRLPPPPSDPFGLGDLLGYAKWILIVGGTAYLVWRFWPQLSGAGKFVGRKLTARRNPGPRRRLQAPKKRRRHLWDETPKQIEKPRQTIKKFAKVTRGKAKRLPKSDKPIEVESEEVA